jgi:hypothetical protein
MVLLKPIDPTEPTPKCALGYGEKVLLLLPATESQAWSRRMLDEEHSRVLIEAETYRVRGTENVEEVTVVGDW